MRTLRTIPHIRRFKNALDSLSVLIFSNTDLLVHYLNKLGIDTVIDVGANNGQFAIDLRYSGFRKKIISYEPIPREFEILCKLSQKDDLWITRNFALSSKRGTVAFNVSDNNGLSSSLLSMTKEHLHLFPNSGHVGQINVMSRTLFDEIESLGVNPSDSLLKIDTQGTELDVLHSAGEKLMSFPFIFLELSHIHLYFGDVLASEVIAYLHNIGFSLREYFPAHRNTKCELIQSNALFINKTFFADK